tara:strand:+ start:632 stop:784 length:153 start_codon:yes stop_codon:yes gene_type:complete
MATTWAEASIEIAWAIATVGISASVAYAVKHIAETLGTYFAFVKIDDDDE